MKMLDCAASVDSEILWFKIAFAIKPLANSDLLYSRLGGRTKAATGVYENLGK